MAYDIHLHRSFDYQLSPIPSTLIDWAPTRRMLCAVLANPLSASSAPSMAPPALIQLHRRETWWIPLRGLERAVQGGRGAPKMAFAHGSPRLPCGAANTLEEQNEPGARGGPRQRSIPHEEGPSNHPPDPGRGLSLGNNEKGSAATAEGLMPANFTVGGEGPVGEAAGNAVCLPRLLSSSPISPMVARAGSAYEPGALGTPLLASKMENIDEADESVGGDKQRTPVMSQAPLKAAETLFRKAFRSISDDGASMVPLHRSMDFAWVSHGYKMFYQRGPLSLSGGLYAAVGYNWSDQRTLHKEVVEKCSNKTGGGMDSSGPFTELLVKAKKEQQGAGSTKQYQGSSTGPMVDLGTIDRWNSIRTMNVLQLVWELAHWGWRGVLNMRLLPVCQHTYVPLFDCSVQTPWLSSSLQSDELALNWSGFLTLYQQPDPRAALARGERSPGRVAKVPPTEAEPGKRPQNLWALRRLVVGVGASLKHDLKSGFNLYWGWSAHLGQGLSFLSHIDMLRRLSCSVSSCLGPLDLSMRLRLNLITLHNTTLDVGCRYRPFPERFPETAMRASTTGAVSCLGLQLDDLTHELFDGWVTRHRRERLGRAAARQSGAEAAPPSPQPGPVPAEGGWIFDWGPPVWGYVAGGWSSEGPPPPTTGKPDGSGALAEEGRGDAPGGRLGFPRYAPPLGQRLWTTAKSGGSALKRAVTVHAARSCQSVRRRAIHSWDAVRRLDWLEEALDAAHLDLSIGITHGAVRGGDHGGKNWSTFIVLSSH